MIDKINQTKIIVSKKDIHFINWCLVNRDNLEGFYKEFMSHSEAILELKNKVKTGETIFIQIDK